MDLRPLYDRIIVQRLDAAAEFNIPGVVIPDTANVKAQRARVMAVGIGRPDPMTGILIPMQTAVGDLVLLGKYAGTEAKINGQEYVILREDEVLAVVQQSQIERITQS